MTSHYDAGEFFVCFDYERDGHRLVVTGRRGLVWKDGTPAAREEVERDYVIPTEEQIQEELDEQTDS